MKTFQVFECWLDREAGIDVQVVEVTEEEFIYRDRNGNGYALTRNKNPFSKNRDEKEEKHFRTEKPDREEAFRRRKFPVKDTDMKEEHP